MATGSASSREGGSANDTPEKVDAQGVAHIAEAAAGALPRASLYTDPVMQASDFDSWEKKNDQVMGGSSSSEVSSSDGGARCRCSVASDALHRHLSVFRHQGDLLGDSIWRVSYSLLWRHACAIVHLCGAATLSFCTRLACCSSPIASKAMDSNCWQASCMAAGATWSGNLVVEGGGFAGVGSPKMDLDLSEYDGIIVRCRSGNGETFKLNIKTQSQEEQPTAAYQASFDTVKGDWVTVRLPWHQFVPVNMAAYDASAPPLDPASISSLGLLYSRFEINDMANPNHSPGAHPAPVAKRCFAQLLVCAMWLVAASCDARRYRTELGLAADALSLAHAHATCVDLARTRILPDLSRRRQLRGCRRIPARD